MYKLLSRSYTPTSRVTLKQVIPTTTRNVIPTIMKCKYSQSNEKSAVKKEVPSFKNIFFMALIGTGIFVFAVNSIERKKKATFSDAQYDNMMKGLRRRVILFNPGEVNIQLVYGKNNNKLPNEIKDTGIVIDPFDVVEQFRSVPNGRFEAMLNDIKSEFGVHNYIYHLPDKMLVSLMKQYIKENCKKGDTITIVDFPNNMSDAMNFENDISQITKIYVPKKDSDADICKYFQTVDKVVFTKL